ncbi:MAG: hypothetical protein NVS4B12_13770 [Ktedonobacteraceae bacterium]
MSIHSRRIDKYELQEQLGHGGMAEVWKAFDVQLQRHVAIKILHADLQEDPNFVARFEREAQFIASLHHPNIVQLHDFQITSPQSSSTTAYMVMDYVEGETLGQYIARTSRRGNIPYPAEIVQLFTSIGLAVDYAHQKGMIHRDLKPANILLDRRNTTHIAVGEPILTDFGVAKLMGSAGNTLAGTHVGTPLYISPEQVNGYAGNERSDIYSLGIILYEMVTGVLPFQGDDPAAVMMQHLKDAPPSPRHINPNIPPALEMVILHCLAKDPATRFPSALSLAAAIAEGLDVPVPETVSKPAYPVDAVDMPTYLTSPLSISTASSSLAQPVVAVSSPALSAQSTPLHTGTSGAGASLITPVAPPTQTPPPVLKSRPKKARRGLVFGLLALLILVFGGSLGAFFLFPRLTSRPVVPTNPIVGHAFFVSSGQLNDGAQGIADTLQVDLQNVQPPSAGKSYYLWLLADKDAMQQQPDLLVPPALHPPLLLTNNLPVRNMAVKYTYAGDAQHNNLLADTSRLLITQEDAGQTPTSPSSNPASWVYYAQLPQAIIPGNLHLRGLDHIRHLYYNEDHLKVLALYGGLDIWVFRNTEKILEWSTSARDDFNGTTNTYGLMHNLFTSILDYLDGTANVHVDVPPGTPVIADANIARVSLLTVDTTKQGVPQYLDTNPPGDLDHLELHLSELVKAPDASPRMRQLAQSILIAVNNAKTWLTQVRVDAKTLFNMTPEQLAQPAAQSLLADLVAQATYAYIGQLNVTNNKVLPGVLQAHYDIQKLATFDITTNVPKSL